MNFQNSNLKKIKVENLKTSNYSIYKVKKGDTLFKIAEYFNVSVKKIIEANNLVGDLIFAGQNLVIPALKVIYRDGFPLTYAASAPKEYITALTPLENGMVAPVSGYNWAVPHYYNATDIASPCGNKIFAAHSGKVINIGFQPGGYGNYLVIDSELGYSTLYAHLKQVLVEIGAQVRQGEEIALVGNTGRATGCHLHFEVRGLLNPLLQYQY
mgnify:CR=1 FL=1